MLALLVEDRRKMLDLRTQLSNKLTAALKGYFPQALALIGTKVVSPWPVIFSNDGPRWLKLKNAAIKPSGPCIPSTRSASPSSSKRAWRWSGTASIW
ncbi:MAG: hypothetical protein OSB73_20925 [Candidatus Latescibacteria bacterium]|nr:hypothetical protein [Candidatus Latescibacterota bacterium]